MAGLFITIEGSDGAGKSTQVKLLGKHFEMQGRQVIYTREPGGTAISEEIRQILLNPIHTAMAVTTEIMLYAAARAQHVDQIIKPALAQECVVICDRFFDSTVAYQGYGRNIDLDLIQQLNTFATGGLTPHITFILDLPVEQGLARAKTRAGAAQPDRIEQEMIDFHYRVRQGFQTLAAKEPDRCYLIEAVAEVENIHKQIISIVERYVCK